MTQKQLALLIFVARVLADSIEQTDPKTFHNIYILLREVLNEHEAKP